MPDWDDIFSKQGRVFIRPHPDMKRLKEQILNQNYATNRILDLGCGTGRHLYYFAKEGFETYGLDGSPKAIELSKDWLSRRKLQASLICQKIEENFPYNDNFFDAIISIQSMHHNLKKDIIKTVKEMERVIKPKGIIFVTFPTVESFKSNDVWKIKQVEKGTYIPTRGPEKGVPHHFFTNKEVKKVFNNFKIKEIYIDKTNHLAVLAIKK